MDEIGRGESWKERKGLIVEETVFIILNYNRFLNFVRIGSYHLSATREQHL